MSDNTWLNVLKKSVQIHITSWRGWSIKIMLKNIIITIYAILNARKLYDVCKSAGIWLTSAPIDYENGVVHSGIDEGNVRGWEGHNRLVKEIEDAIRYWRDKKINDSKDDIPFWRSEAMIRVYIDKTGDMNIYQNYDWVLVSHVDTFIDALTEHMRSTGDGKSFEMDDLTGAITMEE